MDMDLVLLEIEREDRAERAGLHVSPPEPVVSSPLDAIAQLETAIAALRRAREDGAMARALPGGPTRLERLERDAGALLAELLARRG